MSGDRTVGIDGERTGGRLAVVACAKEAVARACADQRYAQAVRPYVILLVPMFFTACATRPAAHGPCAAHEDGCRVRGFALRLNPGDDLRQKLTEFASRQNLRAAYVITCVGSLRAAAIRFADQKNSTVLEGPFEIVSLVGTLSPDGPHLHVSISDASGRTFGGHLGEGSIVYTTAEVVIGELSGARFTRQTDPATTYKELKIQ